MLSKKEIDIIKSMDENYIIGGSNAAMIYIGHDIRNCNDFDLHLSKKINISKLKSILKMDIEIQYDQPEFTSFKGIRLIRLEDLISHKIKRMNPNDVYDLSFLLKLDFDMSEIKLESEREWIILKSFLEKN